MKKITIISLFILIALTSFANSATEKNIVVANGLIPVVFRVPIDPPFGQPILSFPELEMEYDCGWGSDCFDLFWWLPWRH